ncbi:protein of unknown function [Kyrpidia spormannii]|uniref:Uncharacterized protein n=1 Tax=Kyrpidia spormannii TaxID=2055160 RepID=A0A6F9E953_9BACL|nr:protein of unknown function [Kyrpidia spormannii]
MVTQRGRCCEASLKKGGTAKEDLSPLAPHAQRVEGFLFDSARLAKGIIARLSVQQEHPGGALPCSRFLSVMQFPKRGSKN